MHTDKSKVKDCQRSLNLGNEAIDRVSRKELFVSIRTERHLVASVNKSNTTGRGLHCI